METNKELKEEYGQIILMFMGMVLGMAIMMGLVMNGWVGNHSFKQEIIKTFCEK